MPSKAQILTSLLSARAGKNELQMHSQEASGSPVSAWKIALLNSWLCHIRDFADLGKQNILLHKPCFQGFFSFLFTVSLWPFTSFPNHLLLFRSSPLIFHSLSSDRCRLVSPCHSSTAEGKVSEP